MLSQKQNIVKIEGILSEISLDYVKYTKNGKETNAISGLIKVRVDQEVNGQMTQLEIPVHMFSKQYTNAGGVNPAYTSIEKIMKEYTSIAASDIDQADRIRITHGQVQMNEYYKNGNFVSFPRITASFVTKISKTECNPCATFTITALIGNRGYVTDKDGVETDEYKLMGMVPQYGGKIDVVPFYSKNPGVINAVSDMFEPGDTVTFTGKLNFSSKTESVMKEVAFGEPVEEIRTVNVSELIITGGSNPLEGDFAIDQDEAKAALAERKVRLDELKSKDAAQSSPKKADDFSSYGF